ncbi:MAG: iron ABC transporter permease [Sphaerochaetaceae bacterium]|nr:iron ABC transporter permease [Spirochaetaceae bacterium]MDY6344733.1 iron ABC transporter permease [Sphaerochaetaceae bacterium]
MADLRREKTRMIQKDPGLFWALLAIWIALGIFILYPVVRLVGMAFMPDGHFSIATLREAFQDTYTVKALSNSLWLALAVSATGTILGYLFALLVTRTAMPKAMKALLSAVTLLPLISPPFTSSISLSLALGPNGYLLKLFHIPDFQIYGFLGTWLSETLTYFPVAYMVISAVLETMSANLDDAAMSLGASSGRILRTVTIPLSMPGIANSFLLLFGSSLADFATPLILGGHQFPVLPTQAYLEITGMFDLHSGASLSLMLLVPTLIVFWLQRVVVGGKNYVTVTGKSGAQSAFSPLPVVMKVVISLVCALVLAFVLYLYGIILVGSFVKTWGITNTPTMANYQYACKFGRKAITDTLKIAFVSTILGSMLGVVIGFILQRKQFIGHRLLEIGSMLNYALPGTVVGIAYIIAFNKKPFLLTGTMTILVAAYVFRYYATSIRSVMASLEQIDPTLEEASASLGASTAGTFLHVTVPLVIPAVLTGLRYLFIHSMTAISATIFLVSVRWTLLTSRILESMTELQFTQACAFSIILIIIVFIADGLMTWALHMYSVHFLKTKEATK